MQDWTRNTLSILCGTSCLSYAEHLVYLMRNTLSILCGTPCLSYAEHPVYLMRNTLPILCGTPCLSYAEHPAYLMRNTLSILCGTPCLSYAEHPPYLTRNTLSILCGTPCLSYAEHPVYLMRNTLSILCGTLCIKSNMWITMTYFMFPNCVRNKRSNIHNTKQFDACFVFRISYSVFQFVVESPMALESAKSNLWPQQLTWANIRQCRNIPYIYVSSDQKIILEAGGRCDNWHFLITVTIEGSNCLHFE